MALRADQAKAKRNAVSRFHITRDRKLDGSKDGHPSLLYFAILLRV